MERHVIQFRIKTPPYLPLFGVLAFKTVRIAMMLPFFGNLKDAIAPKISRSQK